MDKKLNFKILIFLKHFFSDKLFEQSKRINFVPKLKGIYILFYLIMINFRSSVRIFVYKKCHNTYAAVK